MDTDALRAHLEEQFDLAGLKSLTTELLATGPDEVSGAKTAAAYAGALVTHCRAKGLELALAEAARWRRPDAPLPPLQRRVPSWTSYGAGKTVAGGYLLDDVLGTTEHTLVAAATSGETRVRVKFYASPRRETAEQFLTRGRALAADAPAAFAVPTDAGLEADVLYVASPWQEGTTAESYEPRPGTIVGTAQHILQRVLEALQPMHERGLAHGNLCASNVLLCPNDSDSNSEPPAAVTLLDPGAECLETGAAPLPSLRHPAYSAPEIIEGGLSSPHADVYATGVLAYFLLAGRVPLGEAGGSATQQALHAAWATVAETPAPPSRYSSEHVSEHLDRWVLSLLEKNPEDRPEDAASALRGLRQLHERLSQRPPMPSEQLDGLVAALVEDPTSAQAAMALEAAIDEGAPRKRVARALDMAFVRLADSEETHAAKLNLGFRTARLYQALEDHESAEGVFRKLVELDPESPVAQRGLEEALLHLGQVEAVLETWLEKTESGASPAERSDAWLHIARLYREKLDDTEQALVAATQAVCEVPEGEGVRLVERVCGDDDNAWTEVLDTCSQATTGDLPNEQKQALLRLIGRWYTEKLRRPDIALQCYNALLGLDPADDTALSGLADIYRKAQQWPELIATLSRQAEAAVTATAARALRFEVAELQLAQLNDPTTARQILEGLLDQDPTHDASNELLGRLLREAGDFAGYAALLERWAEAAENETRLKLLCRAAGIHEAHLGSASEAMALYRTVVSEEPSHMGALRGLDRLYGVLGQYDELLANLRDQLQIAATPRQKVELYERIAALYEEEFLSPAQAVEAYESILTLDDNNDSALLGLERGYERLERWQDLAILCARHAEIVSEPERKLALLKRRATTLDVHLGQAAPAIAAYEAVLALAPEDSDALGAMVRLRQSEGDATKALQALERLAEHAPDTATRLDGLRKAGDLLAERGEVAQAVTRWEQALELAPNDSELSARVVDGYVKLKLHEKAIPLLRAQLEATEAPSEQSSILTTLAELERESAPEQARAAAEQALELAPDNVKARRTVLKLQLAAGDLDGAVASALRLAAATEQVSREELRASVLPVIDAVLASETPSLAVPLCDPLLSACPGDVEAAWRAADIEFSHGTSQAAERRISHVVEHFDGQLSPEREALAHFRYAESIRRQGDIKRAIPLLEDAIDLDPQSAAPVRALAACAEDQQDWERAWQLKQQLLELAPAEERFDLLVSLGELAAGPLDDRARATQKFVMALELRPDDRNLLTRLMQLYSEDKDWSKLVAIVLKLADFQDEPRQKAKYLMTAAMVSARELQKFEDAVDLFAKVTELDPSVEKAVTERIDLLSELGRYGEAEALLRTQAEAASAELDNGKLLSILIQLADLFAATERVSEEVDALTAARKVAPEDRELLSRLTEVYRQHADRYLDRAVALQHSILAVDPYRTEAYQALRKLYTRTKNADGAWCLCQALYVLNLAEPDEEKFFVRMRSEDPAYAQSVVTADDWKLLTHPGADQRLTRVFSLIESAAIDGLGRDLTDFGYDPSLEVALARHHFPIGQTIHYAAGVLGLTPPPTYENSNDPGGLTSLATRPPTLSIGASLLTSTDNSQRLAFIAGRRLAYFRTGFHLRQLTVSPSILKTWLFAAIKAVSPSFPIAPDMRTDVEQALNILKQTLGPQATSELGELVGQLLEDSKALDLKRWMSAVDYTADRAGFLLANDLERAIAVIRSSAEDVSTSAPQRTRELVQFAIGPSYLELRARLGLTVQ